MDLQNNLIIWQTCGKVVKVLWYVGLYTLAFGRQLFFKTFPHMTTRSLSNMHDVFCKHACIH